MQTKESIIRAVQEGVAYLKTVPGVREACVIAASNSQSVCRINYTSHIPCNGVEEPKSKEDYGVGVHVVLDTAEGKKVGFGSEANNFSLDGIKLAFEKAREGAVSDAEFVSLPCFDSLSLEHKWTLFDYHDPAMMELGDKEFVNAAWMIVHGAVDAFNASSILETFAVRKGAQSIGNLGLIVGGDLTIIAERFAIGYTHTDKVQFDESTIATCAVTAMVEACQSKGTGYGMYRKLSEVNDGAGREAAKNAIDGCGIMTDAGIQEPVGVENGFYDIIFGPEPVSDMLNNLVLTGLTTACFFDRESPFMGKMGQTIASPEINLYDDAANGELVAAKGMTCEGIPTKRTDLIKGGVLWDLLSNWYETERISRDPDAKEKLGMYPGDLFARGKLQPVSGFRFGTGGGRGYNTQAGIAGTNTVLSANNPKSLADLIKMVGDGLYVGRIWYCYPMNGLRAGDFTTTVVADSYVIKNGKIVAPLKTNAIRINDNILRVLQNIQGVSGNNRGSILWAADEIPYAPDVLVSGVRVEAIGSGNVMMAGG